MRHVYLKTSLPNVRRNDRSVTGAETVGIPLRSIRDEYIEKCRAAIISALNNNSGNKSAAAKELGIKRTTLVEWCRKNMPDVVEPAYRGRLSATVSATVGLADTDSKDVDVE